MVGFFPDMHRALSFSGGDPKTSGERKKVERKELLPGLKGAY